jgi:hypothetical protein
MGENGKEQKEKDKKIGNVKYMNRREQGERTRNIGRERERVTWKRIGDRREDMRNRKRKSHLQENR